MNAAAEERIVVRRPEVASTGSTRERIESLRPIDVNSAGLVFYNYEPVEVLMEPTGMGIRTMINGCYRAGWLHHGYMGMDVVSVEKMQIYGFPVAMATEDRKPIQNMLVGTANVPVSLGRTKELLDSMRALTTGAVAPSRSKINATQFIAALPEGLVQPRIFFGEDDEVVLEWKSEAARVLVTFEGDEAYGYAIKRGARFVPGESSVQRAEEIPADLLTYLQEHFSANDVGA